MKETRRRAALYFLVPLAAILLAGLLYMTTGQLSRVLAGDLHWADWLLLGLMIATALVPPIWGLRQTIRLAEALDQSTGLVRQTLEERLQERLLELSEEKSRLEAVLRNMADGVLLVDGQKRIALVNPAAEAMYGITAAEALGRDHLELTHHFDLDEKLTQVLRTGETATLEIKRAQPEERVLEVRLAPVGHAYTGDGTQARAVLLVLRDITRSRRLEQMRTEFVSNVTHELRTPLTAIRGFAETLAEGALDDPEAAAHFVEIIRKEAGHLNQLIEDLLDLSRIESGKWKMRKEPVELEILARETVGRLRPKASIQGVLLSIEIPADLPPVPADPGRLAQVFLNLVDNALKYTPAGGSVTVSARDAGPLIECRVADTGAGIPKADLPRIFERFYRVDKARTRSTGGTGLGLSIVKHIVDAHGGTISVVSDTGQGAVFTFTLPKGGFPS